jgi:hypothetical protein
MAAAWAAWTTKKLEVNKGKSGTEARLAKTSLAFFGSVLMDSGNLVFGNNKR